jgi:hypothetical protein
MGLKGYRLCVMGQLDSNVQSPTTTRCPAPSYTSLQRRKLHVKAKA